MPTPLAIPYGDHPSQFGELALPDGEPRAVVVVVHGGFWRQRFDLELGRPLAADLAAALDLLAERDLPLDRVVAVGHSAGGHLATWLAARPGLPPDTPGAGPAVRLHGVVSQAGVLDLVDAERNGVGNGAATDLLGGGPDDVPDRYALASPVERLPIGVHVVCVHGTADVNVPIRQSERFVAAAGDEAELVALAGVEHFALIDPATHAWHVCRDAVERLCEPRDPITTERNWFDT